MIHTGGGAFDPHEGHIYFPAANPSMMRIGAEHFDHVLTAVNDLDAAADIDRIEQWMERGNKVFLDSGIFWLTNEHMRKHGCSMNEALALPPEEIDGFDTLFSRYVSVVRRLEAKCWGYIELDQGGLANKRRTRARLEALGLKPIPVYHPLNDGWDYFDELAQSYDRICVGNVVQAAPNVRRKIAATIWERHRQYPHLWIHLLGLTPNRLMAAFPVNSCDSSTWIGGARWGRLYETAGLKTFGELPSPFIYRLGATGEEYEQAIRANWSRFTLVGRTWQTMMAGMESVGCNVYGRAHDVRSGADAEGGVPSVGGRIGEPDVPESPAPASLPHRSARRGQPRQS